MINADILIAPSGIIAFVFFTAAMISGFRKLGFFRYHRNISLLCLLFLIAHIIIAVYLNIIDPVGMAASLFMLASIISGYILKKKFRIHLIFSVLTMFFSLIHIFIVFVSN